MADTDHRTMRRVLHQEMAGTIGLLADEDDFRAMRRYRSFTFDDHHTYLRQVEALLEARAAQGSHTTVALFDPEEYAAYCADTGIDPDTPASRARFAAELATGGATVPYDGRPLAELVPDLVDAAVRRATWEYASQVLARLGRCAVCGADIGHTTYTRAAHLLARILDTAPPGHRHLVCSVTAAPETLLAVLRADQEADGSHRFDDTEAMELTAVLAVGLATHRPGGLVMRTTAPGAPDRVYGWRLRGHGLEPLTAAEVFDAYCTDMDSGDLVAPESGVDYTAPPDLGDSATAPPHQH